MALSLENHTVNRVNHTLAMSKPMKIREAINAWITEHRGVVPDQFLSLNRMVELYHRDVKGIEDTPEHIKRFMGTQVYQAYTWLYSRYNAVLDRRLVTEIITTEPDAEFYGEVLRRLPEWTIRLEISYMAEDAIHNKPLGLDMLVSRAVVDDKDAVIITLTTVDGDGVDGTQYRVYVLDLNKKTLISAALSLAEWNRSPVDGAPFDPAEMRMLTRFMPSLMFLCSQLPTQPKSQGVVQHQHVKVKQKGKQWTLQPANKLDKWCYGAELADVLWDDAGYKARLMENIENDDGNPVPSELACFAGEWDDPEAEDPTFHYDWIPPVFDEKNEEETPL